MLTQILSDYKIAMKEKNEIKKSVLNYLIAQIKNKKIELQRDPNEEEIIALIKKEVKALNEAISFLEKAQKPQQIQEELAKKAVLESYLPAMLDADATKMLIQSLIVELKITDLSKQRGLLMKELMARHKSELDWALVNQIITGLL